MILRPATIEDAEPLAELGRTSFVAKFGHLYRREDLHAFIEQVHSVPAVRQELGDPGLIYRLACTDDAGLLTGYCKLRLASSYAGQSSARQPIELGQLYTDPARTGQGIGAALMDWALQEAARRGCDAILLTVWSENYGAQRFYQRYGFRHIADVDFWVGQHRDHEFLYELRL